MHALHSPKESVILLYARKISFGITKPLWGNIIFFPMLTMKLIQRNVSLAVSKVFQLALHGLYNVNDLNPAVVIELYIV